MVLASLLFLQVSFGWAIHHVFVVLYKLPSRKRDYRPWQNGFHILLGILLLIGGLWQVSTGIDEAEARLEPASIWMMIGELSVFAGSS